MSGRSSRRDFLKQSAAAAGALGALSVARSAHAAGSDAVRLAFIGCGGRGTGACRDMLSVKSAVKLVAIGDIFRERIDRALSGLAGAGLQDRIAVPEEQKFVGFDAYQRAIACDVDLVLLATPPAFRPLHYTAAVKAGRHVFLEKPLCVDAPGYRMVREANRVAKEKKLSVGVGFIRRHQTNYLEGMEKLREGSVGEIRFLRTYFNMPGGYDDNPKPSNMPELEYQLRNWLYFTWLSGDHYVEQACHEIDVANWVMDGPPASANGMGGRQVRTGRGNGQIYDHFAVEYEYAGGVRHFCQARQISGTWQHVSDNIHGTKGATSLGVGPYGMGQEGYRKRESDLPAGYRGVNPYQQEQEDLVASILGGPHEFEGDYGADSSMTAVLGRMAVYSGQVVTWEQAIASEMDLAPDEINFDSPPPVEPNDQGYYPVAMPGVTKAF